MFVNSSIGIDTNNGSIKKPFRTLIKAYGSIIDKLEDNLIILIDSAEKKKNDID